MLNQGLRIPFQKTGYLLEGFGGRLHFDLSVGEGKEFELAWMMQSDKPSVSNQRQASRRESSSSCKVVLNFVLNKTETNM